MELRINDYVRTKKGIIGKIKLIDNQTELEDLYLVKRKWYYKEDFIKSSPNITDLIEVGDILVIKDFVDEACMIFTDIYLIQNEQQLLNIKNDLEKNRNKKLYSIVTCEQFESMKYKIGDK